MFRHKAYYSNLSNQVITTNDYNYSSNPTYLLFLESFGSSELRIDEAIQYFPDQYNDGLFLFDVSEGYENKASQWYCDYRELHDILISKYGLDTFKKMIEEVFYQNMKEAYYFHDSSWDMRRANGYDGKGCTGNSCIPECEYFKPALHSELLPLLKECENNRQLLVRSHLAEQQ